MDTKKVDMIENVVNCPIVQVEGRSYPGVVIQGDSLFSLYRSAEKLLSSVNSDSDNYDYDAAEFLRDSLKEYVSAYEEALGKKGMELPYVKSE
jgi:hypothetical protein